MIFEKDALVSCPINNMAVVVIIITGAHYFGRNLTRSVWLVLFILSVLALLLELIAYRTLGI